MIVAAGEGVVGVLIMAKLEVGSAGSVSIVSFDSGLFSGVFIVGISSGCFFSVVRAVLSSLLTGSGLSPEKAYDTPPNSRIIHALSNIYRTDRFLLPFEKVERGMF